MALFARLSIFVFGRGLMSGGSKSSVASAAAAAARDNKLLPGFGEIEKLLACFFVVNDGSYRDGQLNGFAVSPRSIAAFAVPAALRFVLGIEAKMQQSVVVKAGRENDVASVASITAAGPAARHILLAAKGQAAIAAVACFYRNRYFVNKHGRVKEKGRS